MMRPRTVVMIGSLSLVASWMAGTLSVPAEQSLPVERRSGPRPLGVETTTPAPFTERLRQKLDERPQSPVRGRNPFAFGARRAYSPPDAAPPVVLEAPVQVLPEPMAPAAPQFRLSGVASAAKDGVVDFTAILTDNGVLVFAQTGATLSGGHRLLRVDERSAVIVDAAGAEIVLRLP